MVDVKALEMKGISKSFGGVHALTNVHYNAYRGKVNVLMGENGAGKSTLMRVLAGVISSDAGEILIDGQPVQIGKPQDAKAAGVAMVYQELNLVAQMTVEANMNLGDEWVRSAGFVRIRDSVKRAQALLDEYNLDIDATAEVSTLSIAEQQMLEIAKALASDARIIVMDEPTSSLTTREVKSLFQIIHRLTSENRTVIYISHRMDELKRITDRITVMRDGQYIETLNTKDTNKSALVKLMVGRDLSEDYPQRSTPIGEEVLRVEHLSTVETKLHDVSFTLHKGEILGFAGLVGAGRTETARAIFGIDPKDAGRVFIDGKEAVIRKPLDAINAGIGFVTEDRKTEGLILCRDCKENISIAALRDFVRSGKLNLRREQKSCQDYVEKMHIKTPSLRQKVVNLSGGNQQKIVLAKWLMSDAKVLFLDEPTRGIDIGAKVEVYNIINEIAAAGKCVIVISSEMTELMGICDRIVVMCRGAITGEERKGQFTQESLMYLATGGSAAV